MSKKPNGRGRNWARGQKSGIPAVAGGNPQARRNYWRGRWDSTQSLYTWGEECQMMSEIRAEMRSKGMW